jgi:hypothetical protein
MPKTKKLTTKDAAIVNFVALHESMKKDPTIAPVQRTYMTCKAAYETALAGQNKVLNAEFPDGSIPEDSWWNPETAPALDRYCERAEEVANEVELPFFREQFKKAEQLLLDWGKLIIERSPLYKTNKADVDFMFASDSVGVRNCLIDLILKLDASTIPAPRKALAHR